MSINEDLFVYLFYFMTSKYKAYRKCSRKETLYSKDGDDTSWENLHLFTLSATFHIRNRK